MRTRPLLQAVVLADPGHGHMRPQGLYFIKSWKEAMLEHKDPVEGVKNVKKLLDFFEMKKTTWLNQGRPHVVRALI